MKHDSKTKDFIQAFACKWLTFSFRNGEVEEYTHYVEYTIIGRRRSRVTRGRRVPRTPRMRLYTLAYKNVTTSPPRAWPGITKGSIPRFCILAAKCKHETQNSASSSSVQILHSRHDCTRHLRFVPISRPHTPRLAPYVSGATQRMINRTRLCRLERSRCRPRVRLTTCTGAVQLLSEPPSVASLAA